MDQRALIDLPVPIMTPRLEIRLLQEGDGKALNEAKLETWESLARVFTWAAQEPTYENDEQYVRACHAAWINREDFNFVGIDRQTGKPVVWAGIHCHDWRSKEFQIGYWVRKSAQGQGYAREAANALIRYAFEIFEPNRLIGCHREQNDASRKILNGLGFECEGVRKKGLVVAGGEVADALWYVRFDSEDLPELEVSWERTP